MLEIDGLKAQSGGVVLSPSFVFTAAAALYSVFFPLSCFLRSLKFKSRKEKSLYACLYIISAIHSPLDSHHCQLHIKSKKQLN